METKNAYDQKASVEAMAINKDHPIRFIDQNWKHELTQDQWDDVRPRVVAMLNKCQLESCLVGPNQLLKTTDMAFEALNHQVEMTGKDRMNPNPPELDRKHICALEWAIRILVNNNVLESRIKKIVGAGLTCLIRRSKWSCSSNEGLGISIIEFPEAEGNKILTQCLKAYRVLDYVCRWDMDPFEMEDDCLDKMARARNWLACFCMIDMQVGPWIEKAKKHLKALGLKRVEGFLLGEEDILSRTSFTKREALSSFKKQEASMGEWANYIRAIRNKFPKGLCNGNLIGGDVGFCTAGGKVLAKLAPIVFRSAQLTKKGCQWQLIQSKYRAVCLTVATALLAPLPMDMGLHVLKAFEKCDPTVFPSRMSDSEQEDMAHYQAMKRELITDHYLIAPIDEDEENCTTKKIIN